ncbi:MAG: HAMP domain-containing histidine kinase [Rhodospirillaceae bacterium]|nr:HAMP domain-containing histidine kinase [Rhodospirillaceae bacterium]
MSDDEPKRDPESPTLLSPAVLAHELRSPLGAVKGFAALIAEQAYGALGDPRYLDAAAQMLLACRHMEGLIDGLLDEARMCLGSDTLDEENVDLSNLVATVQTWLQDEIVQAGVVVRARVEIHPIQVRGDVRRLRQAMLNVLGNAIKFTPRGGHIDIGIGGDAAGGIAIVVHNDAALPRAAASGGGCGLGLYITRCQMQAHGGDVSMHQDDEKGMRVILHLPASRRVTQQ